jgi:TolA-binding protein
VTITGPLVMLCSIAFAQDGSADYFTALHNFEQGNYAIARSFFEEFIRERPEGILVPDARYYLIRISQADGDAAEMIGQGFLYLQRQFYGEHRQEVFNLMLSELVSDQAYVLAFDCLKRYDYLKPDSALLWEICHYLIRQPLYSDRAWPYCPREDTFKVLRAQAIADPAEKEKLYKNIRGIKGDLYLIEFFLGCGDTLKAYDLYGKVAGESMKASMPPSLLYRAAKVSRLFDADLFKRQIAALSVNADYSRKAKLLGALQTGILDSEITPSDPEEANMLLQYYRLDTVAVGLPEGICRERLLADTTRTLQYIQTLRKKYRGVFSLDSLYAEALLEQNWCQEAYNVLFRYNKYVNVRPYLRRVKTYADFYYQRYEQALCNVLIMQTKDPDLLYIAARSMEQLNQNPMDLYAKVMELADDTLLKRQAFKNYLKNAYEHQRYNALAGYGPSYFTADGELLDIYLNSLVRTGNKTKADSLLGKPLKKYTAGFMKDYISAYGEYLVEGKKYDQAISYCDSIMRNAPLFLTDKIYYDCALSLFMEQKYAAAESLFDLIFSRYRYGERYAAAAFKIATIKYVNGDFDSAGFFYDIASADTALRLNALQNELIAYKKSEDWDRVIVAGTSLLAVLPDDASDETLFEIGYAYLRRTDGPRAIDYLKRAIAIKPDPEYHYWLAEVYLGRGDFIQALYNYQAIVANFSRDEMWAPTAEFKSGLALEFLGEVEEARSLYRDIIKRRGVADVWGGEAKKRLELIK